MGKSRLCKVGRLVQPTQPTQLRLASPFNGLYRYHPGQMVHSGWPQPDARLAVHMCRISTHRCQLLCQPGPGWQPALTAAAVTLTLTTQTQLQAADSLLGRTDIWYIGCISLPQSRSLCYRCAHWAPCMPIGPLALHCSAPAGAQLQPQHAPTFTAATPLLSRHMPSPHTPQHSSCCPS